MADMDWVNPKKLHYNQKKTHNAHSNESDLVYSHRDHRAKYCIFGHVDLPLDRSKDLSEYPKDRAQYPEKVDRVWSYFYYRDLHSVSVEEYLSYLDLHFESLQMPHSTRRYILMKGYPSGRRLLPSSEKTRQQ